MNEDNKAQKITFHCSNDIAERLDRIAEKGDIPRSKLVANMVEVMLEYLEASEKVGMLHLAILIRDAGRKLQDVAKGWKERNSLKGLSEI